MATCTFAEARALVLSKVLLEVVASRQPRVESVALAEADGRVLAAGILAERDYPPLARSIRDGYGVRAKDLQGALPGELEVIGEVAAGGYFTGTVGAGQCVEIMTGAPVPAGVDAVVMVEYTMREGARMWTDKSPQPGDFINPRAAEVKAGATVLRAGRRLGFAEIAMAATVGCTEVPVFRKPRVAILSTGDEVVPVEQTPEPNQVRNSNAWSLAVQVKRAGGEPHMLPVARDTYADTLRLVEQGLQHDLLLLSGGVSAGKYDVVERVLADCGAEFFFDRVLIQPGQPVVFGRARDKFFFGLPGNPASTMVTFELFGKAAVELLSGQSESPLITPFAQLTHDFHHRKGLTGFLPALLSEDCQKVTHVRWQGSSDVPALSHANAFLVAGADREEWKAGDWIQVLLR
ncbi:MAG: molybdopterin molybdotransferase MoeA [Acidobacteriia bacterium]|nr:molybdopterin molybdotransferase MoeA [Terriglobia bacterium]